jgi:hypothetical protein
MKCLCPLLPIVTSLVNSSIEYGMPSTFKHAVIIPIYKKVQQTRTRYHHTDRRPQHPSQISQLYWGYTFCFELV